MTDGLSQTLFASEVKTYQPVYICDNVGLSLINNPNNVPPPTADPYTVAPEYNGGCRLYLLGHTEWSDGNSHATGFTTAWPPNFVTLGGATGVDMDLNGINEEDGGPTFAAITSRSWHANGVQSLLGDGSVQFFSSFHRRKYLAGLGDRQRRRLGQRHRRGRLVKTMPCRPTTSRDILRAAGFIPVTSRRVYPGGLTASRDEEDRRDKPAGS